MMTRVRHLRLLLLGGLLAVVGCETSSAPERRELLGTWVSQNLQGAEASMTLAESARSVDGAGYWVTGEEVRAFLVSGAIARGEVALYFDFETSENLVFQGYFAAEDSLRGVLAGANVRQTPVVFVRDDLFLSPDQP